MECSDCGFGKPNGIPTDCKALEHSAGRLVEWIRFEDQTMPDGKVNKKQQIPVMGTLGELWEEFMTHTKKYLEHHELSKWQRQAHKMCMETFYWWRPRSSKSSSTKLPLHDRKFAEPRTLRVLLISKQQLFVDFVG